MPSNSFKASQLIMHLNTLIAAHGDMDVIVPNSAEDVVFAITNEDVQAASSANNKPLNGLAITIVGKTPYAVASTGALPGWNYALGQAPVSADPKAPVKLQIYKRHGGVDTGFVDSSGTWSAYEGGNAAWPLVAGGVLAWRPV